MLNFLRKHTPDIMFRGYHRVRSSHAAQKYGFPAKGMIVIGVTGTKGKTSTANYVWSVVHAGGYKTGLLSSANFRIGEKEFSNPYHMTMPDPYLVQKKLREMHSAGVEVVVVEMTSEGMKQFRHLGIPVDIAIFTNLTPEHLTSHKGSFEKYKQAKAPLFRDALAHPVRSLRGRPVPRSIVANADSEHAAYYLQFPADTKITYGIDGGELRAEHVHGAHNGVSFSIGTQRYTLSIPGTFNVYNALPAIAVGGLLGISDADVARGVESLAVIPGRMEEIVVGQPFRVFVDYAHEPASLGAVLHAARALVPAEGNVILLMGGQGGGRDWRKREPMAKLAAELADFVIVTNEDPYEDDPKAIVEELASGVTKYGKEKDSNLFALLDRKEGIQKALSLAHKNDIVVITGKGAEETIMVKGGAIPWNERAIVRELTTPYAHLN